jgi:hypothetical protein
MMEAAEVLVNDEELEQEGAEKPVCGEAQETSERPAPS